MNFPTSFIILFMTGWNLLLGESCDKFGILLYEDLGCEPKYDNMQKCPIKYECEGLTEWNNECYFRGKVYKDQEIVEKNATVLSCNMGCFCNVSPNLKSNFICAVLDCPEWLRVPISPGCYRRYSLDECCSNGEICTHRDDMPSCVFNGIEYKEGEHFFVQSSCLKCVCGDGFSGVLEAPFCRRLACGAQLKFDSEIQNSCAPIYATFQDSGSLCCPVEFICPEGNEIIEEKKKSDELCKYGLLSVFVGQRILYNDQNIICECIIPPLLTCFLY